MKVQTTIYAPGDGGVSETLVQVGELSAIAGWWID